MTSDIEKLSKAINYLEYYIVDSGVHLNFVAEQSLKTLKDYIQKHSRKYCEVKSLKMPDIFSRDC